MLAADARPAVFRILGEPHRVAAGLTRRRSERHGTDRPRRENCPRDKYSRGTSSLGAQHRRVAIRVARRVSMNCMRPTLSSPAGCLHEAPLFSPPTGGAGITDARLSIAHFDQMGKSGFRTDRDRSGLGAQPQRPSSEQPTELAKNGSSGISRRRVVTAMRVAGSA